MAGVNAQTEGRRGYYLYAYGTHLWFPQTLNDFRGGMFREGPRTLIPTNGVYDSLDFLLDQPGLARKRGGTSYANDLVAISNFGTVSYMTAIAKYQKTTASGAGLLCAITDLGDFVPDMSQASSIAIGQVPLTRDKPKMWIGGSKNLMIITDKAQALVPYYFDGANPPRPLGATTQHVAITGTPTGGTITVTALKTSTAGRYLSGAAASITFNSSSASAKTALDGMSVGTFTVTGGSLPGSALEVTVPTGVVLYLATGYNSLTGGSSPAAAVTWTGSASNCPAAIYSTLHLSRVVLANTTANPNRVFFGPLVDPTGAWDATSYVDANNTVTGLAVVNGALLVFSAGALEKFTGDTPPPGTNFVHSTVDTVGCSDARSITVSEGVCFFANTTGVYQTNGGTPESLTEGRIGTYWRSLVGTASSYNADTYTITTVVTARRYLHVTVLSGSRALVVALMCDLTTRAWWRVSGPRTMMFAADDYTDQVYAADATAAYAIKTAGIFLPTANNKNDADGTAVTPLIETRPVSSFPSIAAFGKAHLSYDMRDAASDDPTLAVTIAPGVEAPTYAAVTESPLTETTDAARKKFSTGKRSQALSVKITQSNASSKTEIYALEVDTRGFPREAGGQ